MTKGEQALLVLAAGAFAVWLIHVAVNPWRRCWSCKGTGKGRFSGGRYYGECRACEGGRKRELRAGARWVRPGLRRKQ
jgi:hypothetical protein